MFQYRVTKYDPAYRDQSGRYTRDDWIMFGQVGQECGGTVLTLGEYEWVESAYIDSALAFLREAGIGSLVAQGVENSSGSSSALQEGARVALRELPDVMRRILREEFWCRLEAPGAFVRFGHDYYMYIGVPEACKSACEFARERALFVEPFESPYREDGGPHEEAS